jgi:hypothetical protein
VNKHYSGGKSPPKVPASNIPTRTAATVAATTHQLVFGFFTSAPLYKMGRSYHDPGPMGRISRIVNLDFREFIFWALR